jgi:hypothetical protein
MQTLLSCQKRPVSKETHRVSKEALYMQTHLSLLALLSNARAHEGAGELLLLLLLLPPPPPPLFSLMHVHTVRARV